MTVALQATNVTKVYGDGTNRVVAVDDVSLSIHSGEFVALVGPSGSGKTSLLAMLAGLLHPTSGEVQIAGHNLSTMSEGERTRFRGEAIGFSFQANNLVPYLNALENVQLMLRLNNALNGDGKQRAKELLTRLGLGDRLGNYPGQLSGGQQQRVALGRALAKQPDLLLFDEPLSNLDARLRLTMRAEIKRLQMELGITSIYVTHDQVEAMTMADRIAVIKDGRLQAYCTPDELYDQPQTLFIAGFVGNPPMNFLEAEVARSNGDLRATAEGLQTPVDRARGEKAAGRGPVIVGIRPEDVKLSREPQPDASRGEVYVVEPLGRDDLVTVKLPAGEVHALAEPSTDYRMGETVYVSFDPARLQFFDPATELSLIWR